MIKHLFISGVFLLSALVAVVTKMELYKQPPSSMQSISLIIKPMLYVISKSNCCPILQACLVMG